MVFKLSHIIHSSPKSINLILSNCVRAKPYVILKYILLKVRGDSFKEIEE